MHGWYIRFINLTASVSNNSPQNDGPAERASTFILFADSYLAQGGELSYVTDTLAPAIYKDLNYVVSTWDSTCFDLWYRIYS